MTRKPIHITLITIFALGTMSLAGCETWKGLGKDVSSLGDLVEHVDRALHQHPVHLVAVAVIGNLGQEGHRREHGLDRAPVRWLGLPAPI